MEESFDSTSITIMSSNTTTQQSHIDTATTTNIPDTPYNPLKHKPISLKIPILEHPCWRQNQMTPSTFLGINPNSLCINKHTNKLSEICHTSASFSVDTLCIMEHNLNTSLHTSHQKLYQTAQTIYDHTKLTLASSPIPATNSFNLVVP